jgi:hypothetical protein
MRYGLNFLNSADQNALFSFMFSGLRAGRHPKMMEQLATRISDAADARGPGEMPIVLRRGFGRIAIAIVRLDKEAPLDRTITYFREIARSGDRSAILHYARALEDLAKNALAQGAAEMGYARRYCAFVSAIVSVRATEFMSCVASDRLVVSIMELIKRRARLFASGERVDILKTLRDVDRLKGLSGSLSPSFPPLAA